MKLAVYDDFQLGVVEGTAGDMVVRPITHLVPMAFDLMPAARLNWVAAHWSEVGTAIAAEVATSQVAPLPLADVRLRASSPAPAHVFALPGNYREHLGEIGNLTVSGKRTANEMGFFLKAPGSLVGAGEEIALPQGSERRFDHECELAAVIGARASDVPADRAHEHVFGYTCAVDVTMRIAPGHREEDRSMRKSFATFTPLGPYLVTSDEVGDPHDLTSRLSVNGDVRQSAQTRSMIVNVWQAIEIISSVVALEPGDVILTGTPAGVGPLAIGDEVEIGISRIGSMTLPVVERAAPSPRTF
jgi:2-keto-4-pentenoate hydratase/2-oxohepta-3-ene-1,7-dioic acid hydratase in catechol pathway